MLQWIKDINKCEPMWNVLGFLDDTVDPLAGKRCTHSVIGSILDWEIQQDQYYAVAIANPQAKEKVVKLLKQRGAVFANIIHPRAIIADSAQYGDGIVIYPNTILGPDTSIGNYVTLLSSGIGHDASIGDFSTVSSFCDITGGVQLGKRVFVASHSTIIPKISVGDDAYIGAGSVVIRNVKAETKVFGNPAKKYDL